MGAVHSGGGGLRRRMEEDAAATASAIQNGGVEMAEMIDTILKAKHFYQSWFNYDRMEDDELKVRYTDNSNKNWLGDGKTAHMTLPEAIEKWLPKNACVVSVHINWYSNQIGVTYVLK